VWDLVGIYKIANVVIKKNLLILILRLLHASLCFHNVFGAIV